MCEGDSEIGKDSHEVVLEPDAFVEEELLDPERRGFERVVDRPQRGAGGVADPRRALTCDTIRLAICASELGN